jgi:hypothetical protein
VTLGEHSATIPLAEVVPGASNWQRIYDDAVAYGRDLYNTHVFLVVLNGAIILELFYR